ncbi:hypothetical protein [Rhodococcus triatomae]|nr:hypothetical protein G419_11432 [Rhodococcus triatomae BKS 15-14]
MTIAATDSERGIVDRLLLALLVFDGFLTALLAVLFLPVHVGSVAMPVSALLAGVVNVLLVWCARSVGSGVGQASWPLVAWFVGFLVCLVGGPGGDRLLPADWRTLLLLAVGLLPAIVVLFKFGADAAVTRGQAARTR